MFVCTFIIKHESTGTLTLNNISLKGSDDICSIGNNLIIITNGVIEIESSLFSNLTINNKKESISDVLPKYSSGCWMLV
jgi:hypothetical protein